MAFDGRERKISKRSFLENDTTNEGSTKEEMPDDLLDEIAHDSASYSSVNELSRNATAIVAERILDDTDHDENLKLLRDYFVRMARAVENVHNASSQDYADNEDVDRTKIRFILAKRMAERVLRHIKGKTNKKVIEYLNEGSWIQSEEIANQTAEIYTKHLKEKKRKEIIQQRLCGMNSKVSVIERNSAGYDELLTSIGITPENTGLQNVAKNEKQIIADSSHHVFEDLPRVAVICEALDAISEKYSVVYSGINKKQKRGYVAILIGDVEDAHFPKKIILVNNESHNATFVIHGIADHENNWDEFAALNRNDLKRLQPDVVSCLEDIHDFNEWKKLIIETMSRNQTGNAQDLAQLLEERKSLEKEDGEMTKNQFREKYYRSDGTGDRFEREFENAVATIAQDRKISPLLLPRYFPDEKGAVTAHYPKEIGNLLADIFADRQMEVETDRNTAYGIYRILKSKGYVVSKRIVSEQAAIKAKQHNEYLIAHPDAMREARLGNFDVLMTYDDALAEMIVQDFIDERTVPEGFKDLTNSAKDIAETYVQEGATMIIPISCLEKNIEDEISDNRTLYQPYIKSIYETGKKGQYNYYAPQLRFLVGAALKKFATEPFASLKSVALKINRDEGFLKRKALIEAKPEEIQQRSLPGVRKALVIHQNLAARLEEQYKAA